MPIGRYLSNLWSAVTGGRGEQEQQYYDLPPVGRLDALRWHYENNVTYDRLSTALQGVDNAPILKGIRPLENSAHKVVEFYATKELPSDLEDTIDAPEKLKEAILQIWKWSNWTQTQRVACRWHAMYGNLYIKIASSEDNTRVYFQLIDPRHVTYFEKDEREYFTYLRIDIPQERRDPTATSSEEELVYYHQTEVWDKEAMTYKVYEHEEGSEATIEEIIQSDKGKLVVNQVLDSSSPRRQDREDQRDYTGFDFIPVVHVKFRDIGDDLGVAAFGHCLEAIDDLNLSLTRLSAMLFPEEHTVLKSTLVGREGVPMDAPQLEATLSAAEEDPERVSVGKKLMWRLPPGTDIASLIPDRDITAHIEAIDKALARLEKMLPELAYYRLREFQEISGRAVRLLLGDVIDRVIEARENLLQGLVRANEMGVTVAQSLEIEGFNLGEFEDGKLEHSFEEREVFPISELEKAETDKAELANLQTSLQLFRDAGLDVQPLKDKMLELLKIEPSETQNVPPQDPEAELVGQEPRVQALLAQMTGGTNGRSSGSGEEPNSKFIWEPTDITRRR